jgi:hypothetical protein
MFRVGAQTQGCWHLRLLTIKHRYDSQNSNFLFWQRNMFDCWLLSNKSVINCRKTQGWPNIVTRHEQDYNNTANGTLCDAVSTLYQGVLYFENVILCHGTCKNVISIMPQVKKAFPRSTVTKLTNSKQRYIHVTYTKFHSNWKIRVNVVKQGCRSQRPCGLRRGSVAARLLGLRVRIPPGAWKSVCCECCVLSGRGLCDGLITRLEESYRVWCV